MPAQKTNSAQMMKEIGGVGKEAVAARDAPVSYGQKDLPPGILNGRAKLSKMGFDKFKSGDNVGKWYFAASGIVVEPVEVVTKEGVVNIQGQQTRIRPEPLCDTKYKSGKQVGQVQTKDEHIARVMNWMKMFYPPDQNPFTDLTGMDDAGASRQLIEDLIRIAAELEEAQPYFSFTTRAGAARTVYDPKTKKNTEYPAGVFEDWFGVQGMESYVPPGTEDAVEEEGASAEPEGADDGGDEPPTKGVAAAATSEEPADYDLDDLVKRANTKGGGGGADDKLIAIAVGLGIAKDVAVAADKWEDLADMIRAAQLEAGGGGDVVEEGGDVVEEPAEPEAPAGPTPGDVGKYQPLDAKGKPLISAKTKKPMSPLDVEVVALDGKGLLTLKSLADKTGKTLFKNVAPERFIVA